MVHHAFHPLQTKRRRAADFADKRKPESLKCEDSVGLNRDLRLSCGNLRLVWFALVTAAKRECKVLVISLVRCL